MNLKKKQKSPHLTEEYGARRLTVTKRFWIYLGFFVFTLIFTQILQSKATHILFWFVFLMPFAELAYVLSALGALRAYTVSESASVEKLENYTYELRFINEYIIPYPFVEAVVTLPVVNSVRCSDRVMKISMLPFAKYVVKHGVKFRFRGVYELGIKYIYAYDLFRIFRVRVDINSTTDISVMPRRCFIENSDVDSVSDAADRTLKSPYIFDKLEVSDIRDYRPGDGLKSVHWKLSSKSEEFVVKDYNTGVSKLTYIFCDLSKLYPEEEPQEVSAIRKKAKEEAEESERQNKLLMRKERKKRREKKLKSDKATADISDAQLKEYEERKGKIAGAEKDASDAAKKLAKKRDDSLLYYADKEKTVQSLSADSTMAHALASPAFYEDMNEFCADGVVELTVAAVMRELRQGNACCLMWFDSRAVAGAFGYILESFEDFEHIFERFVTASLTDKENFVTRLSGMISDSQNIKQIFVTSCLDPKAVRSFCSDAVSADATSYGSTEVLFFEPSERFAFRDERRIYLENCKRELSSSGLTITEYRSDDKGLHRM